MRSVLDHGTGDLADDDPLEAELRAEQESYSAQHNSHRRPTPLSEYEAISEKMTYKPFTISSHVEC